MDELVGIIIAPLVIFMIFVAPLWLVLHYRSKRQLNQGLSESDYQKLHELSETAEKMASRIKTLEAILDAESPQWRNKV